MVALPTMPTNPACLSPRTGVPVRIVVPMPTNRCARLCPHRGRSSLCRRTQRMPTKSCARLCPHRGKSRGVPVPMNRCARLEEKSRGVRMPTNRLCRRTVVPRRARKEESQEACLCRRTVAPVLTNRCARLCPHRGTVKGRASAEEPLCLCRVI